MDVMFSDPELGSMCSSRVRLAGRWGVHAGGAELAFCTLRNAVSLKQFISLPNVTKEKDTVIFNTATSMTRLVLEERAVDGRAGVIVTAVDVAEKRA